MKANVYLMFAISLLNSLASYAVDCPSLPSDEIIIHQLRAVNKITATVKMLDKTYTCQAQGTALGSYRSLSIIARYTLDQNLAARIIQFELTCTNINGNISWIGNHSSGADVPDRFEDFETRKNCSSCSSTASNNHHCIGCHSSCLRRCTGQSEADCCDVFSEGVCAKSCPANQVAIEADDNTCQKTSCDPSCVFGTCIAGVCQCFEGIVGTNCSDDINECASGNGGCSHNCTNTFGSFMCSCRIGFELSDDGFTCQEKEPCDPPCEHGTCYRPANVCQCFEGITGRDCSDDIDECACGNGGCSHNCKDTYGGFMCSCAAGYELSEDDSTCQVPSNKFNEAKPCDPGCQNGNCNRTTGACQCSAGYKGENCIEDINECDCDNGGCSHICNNTFGSFECSCRTGYELSSDGKRCQDIDECARCNGGCSHDCSNTDGSFECSCGAHLTLSSDGLRCEGKEPCNGNGMRYYYNSTSKECKEYRWGGCRGNKNNRFLFQHNCEEKCTTDCPPTCTPGFCVTKRSADCTIPNDNGTNLRPDGCVNHKSNCLACVYHDKPLDTFCSTSCAEKCTTGKSWGRCVRQCFYSEYIKISVQRGETDFQCCPY